MLSLPPLPYYYFLIQCDDDTNGIVSSAVTMLSNKSRNRLSGTARLTNGRCSVIIL